MRAPLILFCNNNQWAISTPVEAQTRAETLADKAVGYGMPGVRVDGGDVLAVYEATREAVERGARRRAGRPSSRRSPTGSPPHATADDPRAYIDLERVEEERSTSASAATRLPAPARRAHDDAHAEQVRAEAPSSISAGIAAAEAEPEPDVGLVFEHAYANPPESLGATSPSCAAILGGARWLSGPSSRRSTTPSTSSSPATTRCW